MRSSEEQLDEILRRSARIKRRRAARRRFGISAAAACVCLALLLLSATQLPRASLTAEPDGAIRYGGLILAAPYLGCVIVALLAFLLGLCAASAYFYRKEWKLEGENRHDA